MLMARETKARTAEEIAKAKIPDPIVVCTAFDKNRYSQPVQAMDRLQYMPHVPLHKVREFLQLYAPHTSHKWRYQATYWVATICLNDTVQQM